MSTNRINTLVIDNKLVSDPLKIQQAFISFYTELLCNNMKNRHKINMTVIRTGLVLNEEMRSLLDLSFSNEQIKEAMWSISDTKAPSIDGYDNKFFKAAWPVIGNDIVEAIRSFFRNGKLLKAWSTTAITLVPKVACPTSPGDYRPISCCNVIYKCISKLVYSKLKQVLGGIINQSQGAFVCGRSIAHNILLCQDLVKHYTRKNCSPSCMIKVDLRKAYDTLDWDFIHDMLVALNFPPISLRSLWCASLVHVILCW